MRWYFAAPLNSEEDRENNRLLKERLLKDVPGIDILLPQDNGIGAFDKDPAFITKAIRGDLKDMASADGCLVYHNRPGVDHMGEGTCIEIGIMYEKGRPIVVYNASNFDFGQFIRAIAEITTDYGVLVSILREKNA